MSLSHALLNQANSTIAFANLVLKHQGAKMHFLVLKSLCLDFCINFGRLGFVDTGHFVAQAEPCQDTTNSDRQNVCLVN